MNSDITADALPFAASEATHPAIAGGKSAMLARLFQTGLAVPQGYILTSHALRVYLDVQNEPPLHHIYPPCVASGLTRRFRSVGKRPFGVGSAIFGDGLRRCRTSHTG